MAPDLPFWLVAWYAVFLFSTTLHEAAHAFVALRLGDPTAYRGGQVTLNPVPHLRREPVGMVVVPIISFLLGGWMFGWASAPYDPRWAFAYPRRSGLMALAGPLSNLALVLVSGIAIRIGALAGYFAAPESVTFQQITLAPDGGAPAIAAALLSLTFNLNLILFVFNLMPFPPLDGSGVVQLFLSEEMARGFQSFVRQPMIGWVGIVVAWNLFGPIYRPLRLLVLQLLYPGVGYQ